MTDALLLLSFGGPEGPDDVMPFLRNVTRGRGVPDERLAVVAEHYAHFGGVSPINAQNRALQAALAQRLDVPVYWGNRNWAPYVADAVAQMSADGITRAFAFATSATGGYSSCRQYHEDLARAALPSGPELIKLRHFHDHPLFIRANADRLRDALAGSPEGARLVFTAHSVPVAMDDAAGIDGSLYSRQQHETARLVAEAVRGPGAEFDLVWQSRSGPPAVPWLEPDINDHLRDLAAKGVEAVVVAPTGFVSDHVEVVWDLDREAAQTAAELGITFARARMVGTHPAFVDMVAELLGEHAAGSAGTSCGYDASATCCVRA